MTWVRYLWAGPNTFAGLPLALLAGVTGGRVRVNDGCVEACGGVVRRVLRPPGGAVAVGHVILARDADCLERSRRHERVHVRQYERWGPLTLPVYAVLAVVAWRRGLHPYLDHPFELEAAGGG